MDAKTFEATFGHIADDLARATGLSRVLFLAQFANESGWGTSQLAQHHNLAGIRYTGNFGWDFGGFAAYDSFATFEKDYLRVIHLPFYAALRNTAGHPIATQLAALGESPWSASHYGNPPGSNLLAFMADFTSEPVVIPPAPPPSNETFFWYTVVHGDTLSALAEKYLGNANLYPEIFDLNRDRLTDPNLIITGQEIRIPKKPVVVAPPPAVLTTDTTDVPTPGKFYVVKHGDTLWAIAVAAYGDGTQYHKIVEHNHIENPNLIFSGNKFFIP